VKPGLTFLAWLLVAAVLTAAAASALQAFMVTQ
jgi:hypothetical protein